MITLKEALKLSNDEICELRKDLSAKIRAKNELGAYIEQLNGENLNESGDGIPIAIKDNIQVKGWNVSCASKILQGYIAPYDASAIVNLRSHGCAPFDKYGRICNGWLNRELILWQNLKSTRSHTRPRGKLWRERGGCWWGYSCGCAWKRYRR